MKKNYEIIFQDSPETFIIKEARMIVMDNMVMFRCFDANFELVDVHYYPLCNVHRIKEVC